MSCSRHPTYPRSLRRHLSSDEREQLLTTWYRPHHAALTRAVTAALASSNECLIVDAHSFPSRPLPYEQDQDPDRQDICIGTDEFHTPPALVDLAVRLVEGAGYSVAINRPFAGALVPMAYYGKDDRVQAIMIEVNRRLYLDDETERRGSEFDACRDRLSGIMRGLQSERHASNG